MDTSCPQHNSNGNYLFLFSIQTWDISVGPSDRFPFENSANQIVLHTPLQFSGIPLSRPHPNVKLHLSLFLFDISEYSKGIAINGTPEKEDAIWLCTSMELS